MELTEKEIYQSLLEFSGFISLKKEQAREFLMARIKEYPVWACALPESLLDKLGIKYDHQFDVKDIALAQAIKGRCARRLL